MTGKELDGSCSTDAILCLSLCEKLLSCTFMIYVLFVCMLHSNNKYT